MFGDWEDTVKYGTLGAEFWLMVCFQTRESLSWCQKKNSQRILFMTFNKVVEIQMSIYFRLYWHKPERSYQRSI